MQITAGKYYKTRDGQKIGPVFLNAHNNSHPSHYWKQEGPEINTVSRTSGPYTPAWCRDGRFYETTEHDLDLIEEWTEPTATPAPTGPVRMVRQIVPGVYGRLKVTAKYDANEHGGVFITLVDRIGADHGSGLALVTAEELRSAAMVFSQLAEALDDQP